MSGNLSIHGFPHLRNNSCFWQSCDSNYDLQDFILSVAKKAWLIMRIFKQYSPLRLSAANAKLFCLIYLIYSNERMTNVLEETISNIAGWLCELIYVVSTTVVLSNQEKVNSNFIRRFNFICASNRTPRTALLIKTSICNNKVMTGLCRRPSRSEPAAC